MLLLSQNFDYAYGFAQDDRVGDASRNPQGTVRWISGGLVGRINSNLSLNYLSILLKLSLAEFT